MWPTRRWPVRRASTGARCAPSQGRPPHANAFSLQRRFLDRPLAQGRWCGCACRRLNPPFAPTGGVPYDRQHDPQVSQQRYPLEGRSVILSPAAVRRPAPMRLTTTPGAATQFLASSHSLLRNPPSNHVPNPFGPHGAPRYRFCFCPSFLNHFTFWCSQLLPSLSSLTESVQITKMWVATAAGGSINLKLLSNTI